MAGRREKFFGLTKKGDSESPNGKGRREMEIDLGFGKLYLGGILQGLGDFIDLVAQMEREGKSEIRKEGKIEGLGGEAKGIYGFTIKTALGRKPIVETFGNVKRTKAGPQVKEEREPIVDVFDEKDFIRVVAELPGVPESAIKTKVSGDILTLSAEIGERKYSKEILLPHKVSEKAKKVSYKNGILEIKFEKPKAKG